MTQFELLIGLLVLVAGLFISMAVKHRSKPVPKDHVPPSLEGGVQISKTPNGPAKVEPAKKAPAKKATKKKTTKKKTTKKTSKKVASKK